MINFIAYFIGMLLIGGVLCNGWYIITRYRVEEREDGEIIVKGMVLKSWSGYWEQLDEKNPYIPIFLTGKYLEGRLQLMKILGEHSIVSLVNEGTCFLSSVWLDSDFIDKGLRQYGLKCFEKKAEDNKGYYYFLYREEPNYRFSEYIRKPLSQCITCFSSFYGTFVWFFFSSVFYDEINSLILIFVGWIIFCISLSFINTFMYEKVKTKFNV